MNNIEWKDIIQWCNDAGIEVIKDHNPSLPDGERLIMVFNYASSINGHINIYAKDFQDIDKEHIDNFFKLIFGTDRYWIYEKYLEIVKQKRKAQTKQENWFERREFPKEGEIWEYPSGTKIRIIGLGLNVDDSYEVVIYKTESGTIYTTSIEAFMGVHDIREDGAITLAPNFIRSKE